MLRVIRGSRPITRCAMLLCFSRREISSQSGDGSEESNGNNDGSSDAPPPPTPGSVPSNKRPPATIPKGFQAAYRYPYVSRTATSIDIAYKLTDVEHKIINDLAKRRKHRAIQLLVLCAIGIVSVKLALSRLPKDVTVDKTKLKCKKVNVNLRRHRADMWSDAVLLATKYFVDFNAFETEILESGDNPDMYVAVHVPFPVGPLLFLLLIPLLGFIHEGFGEMRRLLPNMQVPKPDSAHFKFKKELNIKTRLSDVAGLTEAKHEVTEVIDFLKEPERYKKLGAKLPKGVLLDGPPGVGKTLLAKAIAGEARIAFIACSGSEFEEVYVGVGAKRVRELFRLAERNRPCVVFVDEIDAFGKKRQTDGRGHTRSTLNAFLAEMDGFKDARGIVVLAATNRSDILDKALTRTGRFDRKISLERPPHKDRVDIAKVHLKPLLLEPALGVADAAEAIASLTPGSTGADIYNVCNEAAIIASRDHLSFVTMGCIHSALERVFVGLERKAKKVTERERRRVAYHEAGHTVLAWFQPETDPIIKVTITPRGGDKIGVSQRLPSESYIVPQETLRQQMVQRLGGYVSEECFFGDLSVDSSDDMRQVTQLAWEEVCKYGMDPENIGHMHYSAEEGGLQKPYGNEKEDQIDAAVFAVVSDSLKRARELLKKYDKDVKLIAGLLLRKGTLTAQDLWVALGERPVMTPALRRFLEA